MTRGKSRHPHADFFNLDDADYACRYFMTEQHLTLCASLKHLGFLPGNEMKLYGEQFELLSEPIVMADNLVVVEAIEKMSRRLRRVPIPLPVLKTANGQRRAA